MTGNPTLWSVRGFLRKQGQKARLGKETGTSPTNSWVCRGVVLPSKCLVTILLIYHRKCLCKDSQSLPNGLPYYQSVLGELCTCRFSFLGTLPGLTLNIRSRRKKNKKAPARKIMENYTIATVGTPDTPKRWNAAGIFTPLPPVTLSSEHMSSKEAYISKRNVISQGNTDSSSDVRHRTSMRRRYLKGREVLYSTHWP